MPESAKTLSGSKNLATGRMEYIDNLRVLLTVLVVMHHTACTYGDVGGWYYHEGRQDTITMALLGIFTAFNQAYFMSLFFMLSGFFAPQSFYKKGAWHFIKDRLIRLGIPLIIFDIAINPVIVYAKYVKFEHYSKGFISFFSEYMSRFYGIGRGPLWFVDTLLIFSIVYALWAALTKRAKPTEGRNGKFPGNGAIALFALSMGASAFIIRLWKPVGSSFELLNLQVPYISLYIALFIVGIAASERNWFQAIEERTGKIWRKVAIAGLIMCPVLMIAGGALDGDLKNFMGGFKWQAAAYAFWEPFVCMGICVGLLALFRDKFNRRGRLLKLMAENAYTVYIIHAPVLVFVSLWLRGIMLHPLIKFAGVSAITVTLCFMLSHYAIRRIPGAKRIL
ncbi:MAG: acyltransferase [bacterium]